MKHIKAITGGLLAVASAFPACHKEYQLAYLIAIFACAILLDLARDL